MAWIESHQEIRLHPKVRRLATLLEIELSQAIGHLHCLWWWVLDYAPDGDLGQFQNEEIAAACEWSGDAHRLVEALAACRFLDGDPAPMSSTTGSSTAAATCRSAPTTRSGSGAGANGATRKSPQRVSHA